MKECYGQPGWREFHRNRKNILNEYDKVLEQIHNRPIRVSHGVAVEAYIRKWLSEFLPKKYAVTSGYVIPSLYDACAKLFHYDVIIYDCYESPVLWTEGNEDDSEQGKFRAIPAKYVVSIYEVKSRLNRKNICEAHCKLDELSGLKGQLGHNYSCGVIYVDLKEEDNNKESVIKELHSATKIMGFRNSLVLRYEGDDTATGLISLLECGPDDENRKLTPLAKPIDSLGIYFNEEGGVEISEQNAGATFVSTGLDKWSLTKTYGVMFSKDGLAVGLEWSRSNFSRFCIDLLSSLEGLKYDDKNRPSFARVFDSIKKKPTPVQGEVKLSNMPFIRLSVAETNANGEKLKNGYDFKDSRLSFWVLVVNEGDVDAVVSDDGFKTEFEIPARTIALRSQTFEIVINKGRTEEDFMRELKEGFLISYRLVYYPAGKAKNYVALEAGFKVYENAVRIVG